PHRRAVRGLRPVDDQVGAAEAAVQAGARAVRRAAEEQAFPFEEKAIELHEANAARASQGIYDKWVKQSFEALAKLRPVRYGKAERAEGVVDAIR
ncbi:MAG: hypothetical protein AB7U92_06315, partial [Piscinibacter sp.]|uniref:hypothetical protein n=1 Tax=Piscinibacter sp. TaxID=1903157 RepID=UPI003D0A07F5